MTDELLHLTDRETVRVLHEAEDELEVEGTWAPGGSPPPSHLHPAQDEQFEVRAGRLRAVVAGETLELGPGDTLDVPRGTPHKMWNPGPEPAIALWRTRPAGRTADWFRTIDRLGAGGTRRPSPPALVDALSRYSDVFRLAVGPAPLHRLIQLALRLMALVAR